MLTYALAPTGTTGNNTHGPLSGFETAGRLALEFVVEAAGATPTVTFSLQGSFDGTNWFNLATAGTDASAPGVSGAAVTVTATGNTYKFVIGGANGTTSIEDGYLFIPKVRLVTTANTNITYRANLYRVDC